MAKEPGVAKDFHRLFDCRYDLLAETDPESLTSAIQEHGFLAERRQVPTLRLAADVPSGSDADQRSVGRVFRFDGLAWSQAMFPFAPSGGNFKVAKDLAAALGQRVLLVDSTDDCWGGHALFGPDGQIQEIQWFCVNDDLARFLPSLGLEVPDYDDDEEYEDTEFFWSTLRPGDTTGQLSPLLVSLGAWLDSGQPVWEAVDGVERLDLLFEE